MERFWAIVSTIAYSTLWILMIWSHVTCVVTNPGHMPKHYQKLQEKELPATFYELIRERETIYHERIVRKKMRKGELPTDKIRAESMNVENELLDGNL